MSLILRLQILKGTVATNSFKHLFPKRYVPFSIIISETIIYIIISSFFVGTLKSCLPPATNSHPLQVTCLNISPQLFGFYFLCFSSNVTCVSTKSIKPPNSSFCQFSFLWMMIFGFTLTKRMVEWVMINRPVQKQE